MRNVWTIPLTSRRERVARHPSQKPLALMERIVTLATNPEDLILDPFSGVGSTGIAALRHKRRAFLIERDPQYIEAQRGRFQAEGFGDKVLFRSPEDIGGTGEWLEAPDLTSTGTPA